MNTNTETTMSPAEVLAVMKRGEIMMPLGTAARAGWIEDSAKARTAVAALIEREAELIAASEARDAARKEMNAAIADPGRRSLRRIEESLREADDRYFATLAACKPATARNEA